MRGRTVVGALVAAAATLLALDTFLGLDPLARAGSAIAGPVERALGH
ncbi:MAG: rod shape-determining protein MreC, partial [Nonomuraea sp.]|nr:rod shape-determining protein MreC [Nonomuraea sp.]